MDAEEYRKKLDDSLDGKRLIGKQGKRESFDEVGSRLKEAYPDKFELVY